MKAAPAKQRRLRPAVSLAVVMALLAVHQVAAYGLAEAEVGHRLLAPAAGDLLWIVATIAFVAFRLILMLLVPGLLLLTVWEMALERWY